MILGSVLLVFYLLVFLFGPPVLPDFKQRMLGIISALLAGFLAYFLTGSALAQVQLGGAGQFGLRATGGVGVFAVVLFWWSGSSAPVTTSSNAAAELRDKLDSLAAQTSTAPAPSGDRRVTLPTSVQAAAEALARYDPKYVALAHLSDSSSISGTTYLRTRQALTASAGLRVTAPPPRFQVVPDSGPKPNAAHPQGPTTGASSGGSQQVVPTGISPTNATTLATRAPAMIGAVARAATAVPSRITVTLNDAGALLSCRPGLKVSLGDFTVARTSHSQTASGVQAGQNPYSIQGKIFCPMTAACEVSGSGAIDVRAGDVLDLSLIKRSIDRCVLALKKR